MLKNKTLPVKILIWIAALTLILFFSVIIFLLTIKIDTPDVSLESEILKEERIKIAPDFYKLKNNWLKKSDSGLWEIYVEGDGFERGVVEGKLGKELAEEQEIAFVSQIKKMIPSQGMLNYLKYFIAFFNRNIDEHIPEEYKQEIYGESLFASDKFDFMAPKYYRMLNYHAAHDIGHMLQDKNMTAGCSAFSAWGERTVDSSLLVARNFDFYVGDKFAVNKLVYFVNPKNGYKFISVSWAGLIGVVSGMNEKGLSVTINASKSEIPTQAATPISIVAREILQYAKNIDEAFAIAQKRKTFVSESILIGSFEDNRTATIEKTPGKTILHFSENSSSAICVNHFLDSSFSGDPININNIATSSSNYRFKHLTKLIDSKPKMTVADACSILRNRNGINEINIGNGNEKAINQLIAHHAIIFNLTQKKVWISTNPYQLGKFVCYDLNKIFKIAPPLNTKMELYDSSYTIAADSFLFSKEYKQYLIYKRWVSIFKNINHLAVPVNIKESTIANFIKLNPEYYETYFLLGDYYKKLNEKKRSEYYYNIALTKEIPIEKEREAINKQLKQVKLENDF